VLIKSGRILERGKFPEEPEQAVLKGVLQRFEEEGRKSRERTRTERKKPGRHEIQCL